MTSGTTRVSAALLHTTSNLLHQNYGEASQQRDRGGSKVQNANTTSLLSPFFVNTYNPWSSEQKGISDANPPQDANHHHHSIDDDNDLSLSVPWGEINIVVVTDVHSWIAGNHRDDPRNWPLDEHRNRVQDADYGDILSFYQRLGDLVKDHNSNNYGKQRDLFFVMNGDFVDGTGLSENPPRHLMPLLKHMPWDAINVGNHELYSDKTVQFLVQRDGYDSKMGGNRSTIYPVATPPIWNGRYLSSNTLLTETMEPMTGKRYTYLVGPNTNITLLAFGFLYDFHENGPATTTLSVEKVIQQDWFADVLSGGRNSSTGNDYGHEAWKPFDAVLVLAHMDCLDPLVATILEGIRALLPPDKKNIPVQFVTGHTHRRCHARLDDHSESFEAGRFLDTIGFVSFDANTRTTQATNGSNNNRQSDSNFRHRFLDANKQSLLQTLMRSSHLSHGGNQRGLSFSEGFGTPEGRALTRAIRDTQKDLGLDVVLGCSPRTYGIFDYETEPITRAPSSSDANPPRNDWFSESSLWGLYVANVLPRQLLRPMLALSRQARDDSSGEEAAEAHPLFLAGTGSLRYTLFEGPVTVNDVIAISPFNNSIVEIVAKRKGTTDSPGELLPWYGRELSLLLRVTNRLYATSAEYGMPAFVASILPQQDFVRENEGFSLPAASAIDPDRIYRLYTTDYDSWRLISVLAILKFGEGTEDGSVDNNTSFSNDAVDKMLASEPLPPITLGRSYETQKACLALGKNDGENENHHNIDRCYYTAELWKEFVRDAMPCDAVATSSSGHNIRDPPLVSSNGGGSSSSEDGHRIDLLRAQLLQPSFGYSLHAQRPRQEAAPHTGDPPPQEASVVDLAGDEKAAAALVGMASIAAIALLFFFPPRGDNEPPTRGGAPPRARFRQGRCNEGRDHSRRRGNHRTPTAHATTNGNSDSDSDSNRNSVPDEEVQLIPLRRMDTGNLSEHSTQSSNYGSSYGSI
ncbi:unnamed protein product [Pseudo-nitzschia multistriata]|nr:unnamed protein product [Pseudo-nitzschia multistriata]